MEGLVMIEKEEEDDKPEGFFSKKKMIMGASGGVFAFTTAVFGYIDAKTDALDKRIDEKYQATMEYVDLKHNIVEQKLNDIQAILIKIDDRLYKINQGKGE
jgi:hypothetical protein